MTKVLEKINDIFLSGLKPKDIKLVKQGEIKKDEISFEEVIKRYEKSCY